MEIPSQDPADPPVNDSTHPLQIGTLAIWLSVVAAGTFGLLWHPGPMPTVADGEAAVTVALSDLVIGSENPTDVSAGEATASPDLRVEEIVAAVEFPSPPEMPAVSEMAPLPQVPDLPARPAVSANAGPRPAATVTPSRAGAPRKPTGSAGNRGNGGTGMSAAARMSAGSMPAPSYPPEARRRGQTGTVVVEFTVDASGRVISAYAKSPSPWPLLNEEAVRTVRRWKFPPGGVMKLQRPIVFQLR
jgi:TonB family protein